MFSRLSNYINNDKFSLTITDNMLHIINYKKILSLDEEYISVITDNKKINIKGDKLIPQKLLDNEILIIGKIKNIEVVNV